MPTDLSDTKADRRVFEFGQCRLDVGERMLYVEGKPALRLSGRPLGVLIYLLERPGRLLAKRELIDAVWTQVVVGENSLNQAISSLRRAIGDTASIENVPGVGYRFVAEVCLVETGARPKAAQVPSVAVLPFDNLSADKDLSYLADGIVEEVLNRLARVAGLRVIGRTSSVLIRESRESSRTIGARLGATYLLTGCIQQQGDRIRTITQLIDPSNETQIWSGRIEGARSDLFDLQDETAMAALAAVADVIGAQLPEARARLGGTSSAEAYDLYLRARAMMQRMSAPGTSRAMELSKEALALDPAFADAWLELARSSRGLMIFVPAHAAEAARSLAQSVAEALVRAPDHWATHVAAVWERVMARDWHGAERALARADALAPGQPVDLVFAHAMFYAQVGRIELACDYYRKFVRDDPLSALASNLLQSHLLLNGCHDEAEAEYRRGRDLSGSRDVPEHTALQRAWELGDDQLIEERFPLYLASQTVPIPAFHELYEVRHDHAAARAILRSATNAPWAQQAAMPMSALAWWLGHYGDHKGALAAATRAQTELRGAAVSWLWFPSLKNMRRLPEFSQLLRRLGLVDYWQASGDWGEMGREALSREQSGASATRR
jgi:TolB-like protein